ncbi:uncharacterized protein LOC124354515 [Homalodisca vitripennis]|uniref:uncharacterized protein LOC124354515 n=1 Tax=Homalodisca vitripennis TaxID=197043 RepID=UPI001EEA646C|nr:uncharacterized protein LOC124354515 [Homalodisca vitripennis]KAG8259077.1 hypothetical protein J6590_019554 [Homalodisca vitripennis]KAG8303247.1 hypothetical protein J6590_016220 [Homalodisca vitripennis]
MDIDMTEESCKADIKKSKGYEDEIQKTCKKLKIDLEKMDTTEENVKKSPMQTPVQEQPPAWSQIDVSELFWTLSDRKKLNEKQLKPDELHMWGKLNKVKENSETLNRLMYSGLGTVNNCTKILHQILTELGYKYKIESLITFKPLIKTMPHNKAVTIEVETVPRMSFYGLALSENEAIENAARRGLEYLIALS